MATKVSWIKADIQIRLHLKFIAGVMDVDNLGGASATTTAESAATENFILSPS